MLSRVEYLVPLLDHFSRFMFWKFRLECITILDKFDGVVGVAAAGCRPSRRLHKPAAQTKQNKQMQRALTSECCKALLQLQQIYSSRATRHDGADTLGGKSRMYRPNEKTESCEIGPLQPPPVTRRARHTIQTSKELAGDCGLRLLRLHIGSASTPACPHAHRLHCL